MAMKNKNRSELRSSKNTGSLDANAFDKALMEKAAAAIMEEELALYNQPPDAEQPTIPPAMDERIYGLIDDIEKTKKHRRIRKINRVVGVAATVVILAGIFTVYLYNTCEAFRMELLNMTVTPHEKYDELAIDYGTDEEFVKYDEKARFMLQLDYVPKGFKKVSEDSYSMEYRSEDEDYYLIISYLPPGSQPYVDNEKFKSKRIFCHGCEVELRYYKGSHLAIWQDREKYFMLSAIGLNRATFLKVLDGITWPDDK